MNKITSINGTLVASLGELNEHVENETAHVTEKERTAWNAQTTVKAKGILIATQEDLDGHAGNKAIHLTEEERAAWNAKADASAFNVHKNDAVAHVTAEEREGWNDKQDKLTDEGGNMTLPGGLTATTSTINGPLTVENTTGTLSKISGDIWFTGRPEFRTSSIVRGDMWVESGVVRINQNASIAITGSMTASSVINANGGINIPSAVTPRLTGAVTNNELVDYLVDRVVRTAPHITRISGLELADFYSAADSTASPVLRPYSGEMYLSYLKGVNTVAQAVFVGPSGRCLIFPPTQCGPHYYQDHVTVISSPNLLCMSYLTSPGAMVQIKLRVSNDTQYYGVRLRNDDGAAYYELFYKATADSQETVAVREPVPAGINLYAGNYQPQSKLNSLAIYAPGNFNEASHTVVKFGPWSMIVPFMMFDNTQLDLQVHTGSVAVNYYGVGLGVSIGSIHQIAFDYQSQFTPTLNNATYKS